MAKSKFVNRAVEAERIERYAERLLRKIPKKKLLARLKTRVPAAAGSMSEATAKRIMGAPRGRGRPSRELQAKLDQARIVLGIKKGKRTVSKKAASVGRPKAAHVSEAHLEKLIAKILRRMLSKQ